MNDEPIAPRRGVGADEVAPPMRGTESNQCEHEENICEYLYCTNPEH